MTPVLTDPGSRQTVLHIVRSPVGGIFRHIADLAAAQHARSVKVEIVCDSTTGGDLEAQRIEALAQKIGPASVRRIPIPRDINPSDIVNLYRILRHSLALRPSVIHCHGAKGGFYGRIAGRLLKAVARQDVRIVYTPHGGSLHYSPTTLAGRLYFAIERSLERFTDCIIHVSQDEMMSYRRKVGTPRCDSRVIYSGLMPEEFAVEGAQTPLVDFAYVGMLRDLKGVDVFIRSLRPLIAAKPNVRVWVVGGGDPVDVRRYVDLVNQLELSEYVTFRDPSPIDELLPKIGTLVVPSRAEALGYVLLEAAAAGVPIIATRVGGIPEILSEDGDLLVEPGDVDGLAQAMIWAIDNRGPMLAAAEERRSRIGQRFSISKMVAETQQAYEASLRRCS